jgi:hypothetical protein
MTHKKAVQCTRCNYLHLESDRIEILGNDGWNHLSCPKCKGRVTIESEILEDTLIGQRLDKKAKYKLIKSDIEKISDEACTCSPSYQSLGCAAYKHGLCIWHPNNDPYKQKEKEWCEDFLKDDLNLEILEP